MTGRRAGTRRPDTAAGPRPASGTTGKRPVINDVDLVADVLYIAVARGYVLVGPARQVFAGADDDPDTVIPVPAYEQNTVHQLLEVGHLAEASCVRRVRCQGREVWADVVRVPRATRAMVTRWAHLKPARRTAPPKPADQPTDEHAGPTGGGRVLWCPECGERAITRPPVRWTAANGPRPEHSHVDGEPLCPVMTAQGYRPARPVARRPD